jgi:hypothetical protein
MDGYPSALDIMVVQIDGIHISDQFVLVAALGIDSQGFKHPLGLMEGATEHSAVVQALIDDLVRPVLDYLQRFEVVPRQAPDAVLGPVDVFSADRAVADLHPLDGWYGDRFDNSC